MTMKNCSDRRSDHEKFDFSMVSPLDVLLWRWLQSLFMAQGRKRNNFVPRTCVSPLWKDSTSSDVVTLRMRPPQTPFTSLDTFMAAHSPRRFCQTRQKYILSECITFISAQLFLIYFRSRVNVIKIKLNLNRNLVYEREDDGMFVFFFICMQNLWLWIKELQILGLYLSNRRQEMTRGE